MPIHYLLQWIQINTLWFLFDQTYADIRKFLSSWSTVLYFSNNHCIISYDVSIFQVCLWRISYSSCRLSKNVSQKTPCGHYHSPHCSSLTSSMTWPSTTPSHSYDEGPTIGYDKGVPTIGYNKGVPNMVFNCISILVLKISYCFCRTSKLLW